MGKLLRCLSMRNCRFWIPSNFCGVLHVQGAEFGTVPLLEPNLASRIGLAPSGQKVRARNCFQEKPYRTPVTMFCRAPHDKVWGKPERGMFSTFLLWDPALLDHGALGSLGGPHSHVGAMLRWSFLSIGKLNEGESVVSNWNGVGTHFWKSK